MEGSGENTAGQGTSKRENENSCYVCLEKFESKSHLNWHEISVHENPKNFKCSDCNETSFDSKSAFLKHRKSHVKTKEPSICQTCGKKFKWPSALRKHIFSHTAKVTRDCEVLPLEKCVENSADINQDTTKNLNEIVNNYSCDICLENFESKSHLLLHEIHVHENTKNYKCLDCNATYASKRALALHRKVHFKGGQSLVCPPCNKTYTTPFQLREHIRIHTGERPFKCQICHKSFSQMACLTRHERIIHTRRTRKKYLTSADLSRHVLSHSRPFPCQICPLRFASKRSLIRHKGIHTGSKPFESKPFECNDCGMSFRFLHILRIHALTVHHGLKPNKCSICNKEYSSRKGLRGHVRRNRHYDSALAEGETKQEELKNELVTESKDEKNSDKDEPIKNEENELTIPMVVELD